jgi:hypothetical protein
MVCFSCYFLFHSIVKCWILCLSHFPMVGFYFPFLQEFPNGKLHSFQMLDIVPNGL